MYFDQHAVRMRQWVNRIEGEEAKPFYGRGEYKRTRRDPVSLHTSQHSPLQHTRHLCLCLLIAVFTSLSMPVMFTTPGSLTLITTPPPRCFSNCFPSRSAKLASSFSYLCNPPPNSRQKLKSLSISWSNLSVARWRLVRLGQGG